MLYINEITSAFARAVDCGNEHTFPIVVPEGTDYPFNVYERQGIDFIYTKDGKCDSAEFRFAVKVVANSYAKTLDIVEKIIGSLHNMSSEHIAYSDITITEITEEYANEAFVQTIYITFTTKVK